MAAQTLEQKKQVYSRQLAAHTFRQWNAVRQNQFSEKKDKPDSKEPDAQRTHDEKQSRFGGDQQTHTPEKQDQNKNYAVQVVDYARTPGRDRDVSKENLKRTNEI